MAKTETVDSVNEGAETRLGLLKSRLKVAKAFSKKPHKAMRKWIDEYNIENISDTDEIRDKVRIGYIFRKVESEVPAIFDDQPDLFIKGRATSTEDIEPVIEGTYDYLWDIQRLEEVIDDVGVYFELLGMGFVESPWVTKTKKVTEMVETPVLDELGQPMLDEMGQPLLQQVPQEYEIPLIDNPQASAVDPFKLHFSPETKFAPILTYDNCPYYFKEISMTVEEVKAKFGKTVEATEKMKTDDADMDVQMDKELDQMGKDDMKRVTVYEYYGCLTEDLAKGIKDAEGKAVEWAYDKDYHLFFTANEELKAEECPYDQKPLFIVGNYGLANKFWKFGEAKHLKPLVSELEKYRTQILKHTRKMANPKPMIPTSANVDEAAFRSPIEGTLVKFEGVTAPSYLSPSNLGSEVATGVEMVRTDLEKTAGTFDIGGGGSSSQVKTPRGISVYAEASDRNVRRKRKKIARLIRELLIFQFKQISMYWKPEDEKQIPVDGVQGPEQAIVTPEVLELLSSVSIMYTIDIEIESLSVNKEQMKRDALDLWDIMAAAPQVFNLHEGAKDLLQNGFNKKDADRFLTTPEEQLQMMIAQNPQLAMQILESLMQGEVPAGNESVGGQVAPEASGLGEEVLQPAPEIQ